MRLIRRNRPTPKGPAPAARTPRPTHDQAGILPWRRSDSGEVQVLLITSRGGQRWIIPKGWPMARRTLAQSASQEAFEEAGVRGETNPEPIGSFVTDKSDWLGRIRTLQVVVYAMEVREELADWPEKHERTRMWCAGSDAARVVDSPSLKALLGSVSGSLGNCG